MRFDNKVIIVTGASSGIGAASAILFAKGGADVVMVGRNEVKLKNVENQCAEAGKAPLVINADVSVEEDAVRIVEETIEKYNKIDVLVNNAGILRYGTILDGKVFSCFDEVIKTNLRAPIHLTTLVAPHLIKTKGNIVNVSSVLGTSIVKSFNRQAYCVSKAGLDHFARGAALELAAYGVRVNVVSPGPVKSDILEGIESQTSWEAEAQATLLNRVSTPEEIAELIAFLASDAAKGITGSNYLIDNGCILK